MVHAGRWCVGVVVLMDTGGHVRYGMACWVRMGLVARCLVPGTMLEDIWRVTFLGGPWPIRLAE